jgi:hypothetical protein
MGDGPAGGGGVGGRGGVGGGLLDIQHVIPVNQHTGSAVAWLTEKAADVLRCDGYDVDRHAQVVRSPTNSREVIACIGTFGVEDTPNCTTTRNLLSMIEPIAAYAGYGGGLVLGRPPVVLQRRQCAT